jgi:hypothetical protein
MTDLATHLRPDPRTLFESKRKKFDSAGSIARVREFETGRK